MKKILFLKLGSFSNINDAVAEQFVRNFPDFELEVVDLVELTKGDLSSPRNLTCLFCEYGVDFALRRKSWRSWSDWAMVTSFMFKTMKRRIREIARTEDLSFTFQTQSMFDGSLPGIPHFVYTDSTVLANRHYPDSRPGTYLKSPAWMKLEKTVYANAAVNFTFSENQSRSIIGDYGIAPDRVECVHAGSNTRPPGRGEPDYLGKNILFVGVNWERKGGPALERAFRNVLGRHPDARLTVVGCSPSLDLPNCSVIGRVPLHEVERYYSDASVFCMPTRQEPFGIAFLEAMQRKLPVVASSVGALPEIVVHGASGLLYAPDDVDGLSEGLIYLLDHPDLCARFGQAGFERYEQLYTWDLTGKRMKAAIESVLRASG